MSENIEIHLASIKKPIETILTLFGDRTGTPVRIECHIEARDVCQLKSLTELGNWNPEQATWEVFAIFEVMHLADVSFRNVLFNISSFGGVFDIEITVGADDVPLKNRKRFLKTLCDDISEIGHSLGAAQWYAGMEPAEDENTRYFTDSLLGPLHKLVVK